MLKKFNKLNLDDELLTDAFSDQVIGPCKPGCNFFKHLGRGPPLQVPMPETIYIGPGNFIKMLYNEPTKGTLAQEVLHFEHQLVRDEFITNCVQRFVQDSVPLTIPAEPIYARFVAVQKKAAVKSTRACVNNQSDFLLPVAFQSQLLEITDNNLSPCVIQKLIKSRGKRPSVYRLFWKRASNETGAAEGWNITKISDEFKAPELITLDQSQPTTKANEDQNAEELEELTFRKQTTKFIASYIRAGEATTGEEVDLYDAEIEKLAKEIKAMSFRPFSAPAARKSIRSSMHSATSVHGCEGEGEKDHTFLTSAPNEEVSKTKQKPTRNSLLRSSQLSTAYTILSDKRPDGEEHQRDKSHHEDPNKHYRRHSVEYFTSHTVEEIDEMFVKGMLSKMYINPADRTRALLINAKANAEVGMRNSTSISNNEGELSAEKCSKLTISRVSSAALEEPIGYLAQIAHWLQVMLRDVHRLQVFISDLVGDFIKDDDGKWWFINLKSFKLTDDSFSKVQLWHAIHVEHKPPSSTQHHQHKPLNNRERIAKNETERGTFCNTCGLHYLPNQTTLSSDGLQVIPVFGYQITYAIAKRIVKIFFKHGIPSTQFARNLMKTDEHGDINTRSIKLLLNQHNSSQNNLHRDQSGEKIQCCFRCYQIYQDLILVEKELTSLYQFLGADTTASLDKIKAEELLVKQSKVPYDMSVVKILSPSPMNNNMSIFQRNSANNLTDNAASGSLLTRRPLSASALHSRNNNENSHLFGPLQSLRTSQEKDLTDDEKSLKRLIGMIKERSASIPNSLKYVTYHSIPYGVKHFRLLCMFHYAIIEEPERLRNQLLQNDSLGKNMSKYYTIQYSFGQQQISIPFVFSAMAHLKTWLELESKDDYSPKTMMRKQKKMMNNIEKRSGVSQSQKKKGSQGNIIFIKECRLHSILGKPADLAEYFKEHLVSCKLFSLPPEPNNPYNSGSSSPTPTAKINANTSHASLPSLSAAQWVNKSCDESTKSIRQEGVFSLYMSKLTLQSQSTSFAHLSGTNHIPSSLANGTEKQDLLVTIATPSLGTISLKISVAIVQDEALPSNLSSQERFGSHKEQVFFPPKGYVPEDLPLPNAWLSMLLSRQSASSEPRSRRRSTLLSTQTHTTATTTTTEDDSDRDSTSSIEINDEEDNLIERLLDREFERDKREKEERLLQKEREEQKNDSIEDEFGDKVQGLKSQPRKTISLLAPAGNEQNLGNQNNTSPNSRKSAFLPRRTFTNKSAEVAAGGEKFPSPTKPSNSLPPVEEKPDQVDNNLPDSSNERSNSGSHSNRLTTRKSRVISNIAAALKQREQNSGSDSEASGTLTRSTFLEKNIQNSLPSPTPPPLPRRQRSYSQISNDLLKFTAFQGSASYVSPVLQRHFEGIESLFRLFEEKIQTIGEGEVDSKEVLAKISSLLHHVQDVYSAYQTAVQNRLAAEQERDREQKLVEQRIAEEEDEEGDESSTEDSGPRPAAQQSDQSSKGVSFFTIARVMSRYTSVKKVSNALHASGEHGTTSFAKAASIKDLLLMRASSAQSFQQIMSSVLSNNLHNPSFTVPLDGAAGIGEGKQTEAVHDKETGGDGEETSLHHIAISIAELSYLSPSLLDAMILTMRQLTVMDYLPGHISWAMFKPLLLESLPTFLTEKE